MLRNIQEKLYNLGGSRKIIMILFLVAIFIGIAFYIYKTYISPRINPSYVENKEILTEEAQKEAVLYFFYTTWCPHCKKAKPEWQKIKDEYQDKPINNTRVIFREVDCDKEEEVADKFKVDGYPTIKLIKDDQIIEYDAKPNYETLVQFLHTTL
jgi:thiol-disulfide isomerase/thioredoxin